MTRCIDDIGKLFVNLSGMSDVHFFFNLSGISDVHFFLLML